MEKIDLHTHTNNSDGILSPEQLVQESIKNNCYKMSITDHDIIKDYKELSNKYGIEIINGIEFNTSISYLHLLGYGIKDLDNITKIMNNIRRKNEEICFKIIELLEKDNFDISISKIYEYLEEININKEIIDKRKLVKYLIYKGYAEDILDAYNKLIGKNQKYYIPNYKISPKETIEIVNNNGGICVWAHPKSVYKNNNKIYELAKEMKNYGLIGLETINKKTNINEIKPLEEIAEDLDLIETVGSDFHNPNIDEIGLKVDEKIYDNFQKKLTR